MPNPFSFRALKCKHLLRPGNYGAGVVILYKDGILMDTIQQLSGSYHQYSLEGRKPVLVSRQ